MVSYSRLGTNLKTASGYYDEVTAMSQSIINAGFESLFDANPAMKKIYVQDPDLGVIDATLLPSRILIPQITGVDMSKVLFQIRFDKGHLQNVSGRLKQDVSGWILAVDIDLGIIDPTINPDDSPETKAAKQKEKDFIENTFNVPGDFSIERLYAKLSDSSWNNFNLDNSSFGVKNGKVQTYDDWKASNKGLSIILSAFLQFWAQDMQDKNLNTLGVKFQLLPTAKLDPLSPTFPPTSMQHQTYPYRDAKYPTGGSGFDVPGSLNCLLYGDMTQKRDLPSSLLLGYSGNFVTLPSTPGGTDGIDGTFSLGHQVFFRDFLLKQLQPFNQALEVFPIQPTWEDGNNSITVRWTYHAGGDPNHLSALDPVYQFVPDNADLPTAYTFTKDNSIVSPIHQLSGANFYSNFKSSGSPSTRVSWDQGGKIIHFTGSTDYKYDNESSQNSDVSNPNCWLRDVFKVRFSTSIEISTVEGGVMKLLLDPNKKGTFTVEQDMSQHAAQNSITPPGQADNIRNTISSQINNWITHLETNLSAAFKSTGAYVYPGNGQLVFSNPLINNCGDIMAEIKYKGLTPGDKITVPGAGGIQMKPIKDIVPKAFKATVPVQRPFPKLTWTSNNPLAADSENVKIVIKGTNNSQDIVYLGEVVLTVLSNTNGTEILSGSTLTVRSDSKFGSQDNVVDLMDFPVGTLDLAPVQVDLVHSLNGVKTWNVIVTPANGDIVVAPGAGMIITIEADTGKTATEKIIVAHEEWRDEDGKPLSPFDENILVTLESPNLLGRLTGLVSK